MITLSVDKADTFVSKLQRKGVDVKWDGWKMVFWAEHPRAARSVAGRRRGNTWGFETVVSPNDDGNWLVQHGLTRRGKVATG